MGTLFLGTSGYSYKHWKGVFYPSDLPQARWLEFYCQHFDTVELNVTFYRLPKRQTFEGWYRRTPPHFLFAAKGSRYITHIKRLKDCREPVRAYRENAAGLGDKLTSSRTISAKTSFKKNRRPNIVVPQNCDCTIMAPILLQIVAPQLAQRVY